MLARWDELPEIMRNDEVKKYYLLLEKHKRTLCAKRIFDVVMAAILLILLSPLLLVIAIWIKLDSKGPVMYRQIRVTQYGKYFKIYKFRTMIGDADKKGTLLTIQNDQRLTKVGKKIRMMRLDEIPQLVNVLAGDMSFVGTRPEVPKYVEKYTSEMYATLLLPAGITSEASIMFKDENQYLEQAVNAEEVYISKVLPQKMKYNLHSLENFSLINELKIMLKTIGAILK